MPSTSTSINSLRKSPVSEPPVVNASPLIYLAHADLFHLSSRGSAKSGCISPTALWNPFIASSAPTSRRLLFSRVVAEPFNSALF